MKDAEIIAVIERHPDGLTSRQVADVLARDLCNMQSRLSKLYQYGKISRLRGGLGQGAALWSPRRNGDQR